MTLTDDGIERLEQRLGVGNLYDPVNLETLHILNQALRAHTLYKRDVNYMIEEGKVLIIDEFTGRMLPGRRWSDGLHQAVEAKEGVEIQEENQTLATISFQNFFRIYKKLSGMTGTADTEAEEFHKIYKLDVTRRPDQQGHAAQGRATTSSTRPSARSSRAVVDEIVDCHERGQPVLVGTTSVEKSEVVASLLRKKGIPHNVLNAKQHENEAYVVAQAGRKGAVTVSTNMAGRGTDIMLGGNAEFMARAEIDPENAGKPGHEWPPEQEEAFKQDFARFKAQCDAEKQEVLAAGGLHILGTERHESRRIDNQLRGRAGRQGDPGSSRFYLSLEDDLMRIFAGERVTRADGAPGHGRGRAIEHPWVTKAIENAQKKVEGRNFDIRKNLLEYDDVMNQQRKTIYALRRQILEGRYAPEPTDEEKKQGKTAADQPVPTESGKHTATSLAKTARPMLARMCEDLTEARAPDPNAPDGFSVVKVELQPAFLRSAIYQQFGAYPDPTGILEDRTATLDRLADEVGSSMVQQRERLLDLCEEILQGVVDESCPPHAHAEDWDLDALRAATKERFNFEPTIDEGKIMEREALVEALWADVEKVIDAREAELSLPGLLFYCRRFYLQEIDERWIEHLKSMEALREGIGLRGYGQKDPKQEYKKEGFVIFGEMMRSIGRNVCEKVFHIQVGRRRHGAAAGAAPAPRAADGRIRRRRRAPRPPAATASRRRKRASRCAAISPRSGATIRVPAEVVKSTRNATAP